MAFELNTETHVTLAAMDIVGFSRNLENAQGLCHDRNNLITAVKGTRLFPRALRSGAVRVHFLGDELRLAFLQTAASPTEVVDFVDEVNRALEDLPADIGTAVRSLILTGSLKVRDLRGCQYLYGELPLEAERWLQHVDGGCLATPWQTLDSSPAAPILPGVWVKRVSSRAFSAEMPFSTRARPGKPHFVIAVGTRVQADAPPRDRLRAFDQLVSIVQEVLSQDVPTDAPVMVSVAPGGVMLAVESDTFDAAHVIVEALQSVGMQSGLGLAAALATGSLTPVREDWLSDNFEGGPAIVAARLLSRLKRDELGVAPTVLPFWSSAARFEARTLAGKRTEEFVARLHTSWFRPSELPSRAELKAGPVSTQLELDHRAGSPELPTGPYEATRSDSARPSTVRDQLMHLVREEYLQSHHGENAAREEVEILFSRLLQHVADVTVAMDRTENIIADLCNWILQQRDGVELFVQGAAGTGKTTLLALLYWRLLRESKHRPTVFVHYIDIHYFSRVVYENTTEPYEQQALALCRKHLEPLAALLRESPDCTLVLILDGVDPSEQPGYSESIRHEIRECVRRAKQRHFIGMRAAEAHDTLPAQPLRRNPALVTLRRIPVQDPSLPAFVTAYLEFKRFPATAKDTSTFVNTIRQLKVRDVDMFTLRTLIRALEPGPARPAGRLTLAAAIAAYCRDFLRAAGHETLDSAGRLAFDREVLREDFSPDRIRGSHGWQLYHTHPIVKWFLISHYVMEAFTSWGRSHAEGRPIDRGPGPQRFPYPYEVNRFCRELLNEEDRESKVLLACKHLVETGDIPDRIHAAYLLGRVENRNLRKEAADILIALGRRLETVDATMALSSDARERQQYLLLRRTVSISLIQVTEGRSPHLDSYLGELLRNPEWDSVNRGFHLEYYGDLQYSPATAFIHNDVLGPCDRTVEQLKGRIALGPAKNPMFELELQTLSSLVQHRVAAGAEGSARLASELVPLLTGHADEVQNDLLKGYLSMLRDHLVLDGTGCGQLVEHIYRLKQLRRSGWVARGLHTADEVTVSESVADHTIGAYMLGVFFLPERSDELGYDKNEILKTILFHDLGEAINGDLLPHERTGERAELERQAIRYFSLAGTYPGMGETAPLLGLWEDFEHEKSENAKVAGDLDRLDIVVQTYVYGKEGRVARPGHGSLESLRSSVARQLKTSHGRRILQMLRRHFER